MKNEIAPDTFRRLIRLDGTKATLVIKVKPNASVEKLSLNDANEIVLSVRAQAVEGKANERVIELLAKIFSVPKSSIAVVRGHHARVKTIVIQNLHFG